MFSFIINNIDVFLNIISKHVKINLAFIFNEFNTPKKESYISIDVVIPLIAKDLLTVENCIAGLKKHSLNRIRNIYIISPNDDKIIFFAKQNKLVYLNEDLISGVSNNEIIEYIKNDKMIGWLKQQIIKLNIDNIPSIGKNVLLIDSDTILCKDQYFISDSYSILKFSDEFHIKYRLANYLLLKKFDFKPISFISHHQIINLEYLKELKSKVESNSKLKFNYAFLEAYKKIGMVSEYELYAQYVLTYHSEKYKTQYWFNDNLTINAKSIKLSKRAISYSLHNYNYK